MAIIPDLTRTACDRALKRLAAGDVSALETIYHQLGRKIFMTAFSVLGDTHAAEDVMQDTFLRLTEYAHAYREEGNAVAYILTVTRRLAINELEKRKREFPAEEIFGADKIVIVTQEYHLYRSLYVAEALGIEAYGVGADYRGYIGQSARDLREVLARVKDFAMAIFKPEPTYLGETIPISGNGELTHDENSDFTTNGGK